MKVHLEVNGKQVVVDALPDTCLIEVLAPQCGLIGAKEACGQGECGACTVLIDGRPVLACLTLVTRIRGMVQTVEGVTANYPPLREAFADRGALQCGYCTSGMLVSAVHLLDEGKTNSEEEIRAGLVGNICRCTGYGAIASALIDTDQVQDANR